MPIKIADGLDAITELKKEGIVTINEARARTQDIRPLTPKGTRDRVTTQFRSCVAADAF